MPLPALGAELLGARGLLDAPLPLLLVRLVRTPLRDVLRVELADLEAHLE